MAANRDARITLVERFIDFSDWPPSRKTALAALGASTTHLFGVVAALLLRPSALDVPAFIRVVVSGGVLLIAIAAVCQVVYLRGHEGRWTVYFFPNLYAVFIVLLVVELGGMTSPVMAFPMFLPLFA